MRGSALGFEGKSEETATTLNSPGLDWGEKWNKLDLLPS